MTSARVGSARLQIGVRSPLKESAEKRSQMATLREQLESELWRLVPEGWDEKKVRTRVPKPEERPRRTKWKITGLPDPNIELEEQSALVRSQGGPGSMKAVARPKKPPPMKLSIKKKPLPVLIPDGHGNWAQPGAQNLFELRSHLAKGCVVITIVDPSTSLRVWTKENTPLGLGTVTAIGKADIMIQDLRLGNQADNPEGEWADSTVWIVDQAVKPQKFTLNKLWEVDSEGMWLPPDPNAKKGEMRWLQQGSMVPPPKDKASPTSSPSVSPPLSPVKRPASP